MYQFVDEKHPLGNSGTIKNRLRFPRSWRSCDITMPEPKCPQKLVQRYPYQRITKQQWDMIKYYYRFGYSVRMIGRCYGYHESNIITRAKKEGWVFNDLGVLCNQTANALNDMRAGALQMLKEHNIPVDCWYIVLREYNTLLQVGGSKWLLFSVGRKIEISTRELCNIPFKFIPTLADIERERKRQTKQK